MANPPAAWYPDPHNPDQWRYWNGAAWTNHYAPRVIRPTAMQRIPPAQRAVVNIAAVSTPDVRTRDEVSRAPVSDQAVPSLEEIVRQMRLEKPRSPLDEQVEVAGETYHIKGIRRVFKDHGMPITAAGTTLDDLQCILVPERWNQHDPNSVAVMVGLHQVGHIPAELAREYSPPLLRLAANGVLATGVARIWAKLDAGMARARVTLLLPEAREFR